MSPEAAPAGGSPTSVIEWRLERLEKQNEEILKSLRDSIAEISKTFVRNDTYALEKLSQDDEIRGIRKELKEDRLKAADDRAKREKLKLWLVGAIAWPIVVVIVGALAYNGFK